MAYMLTLLTLCVYNLILLAGTAWLVLEHDWNPWWFALTVCLLGSKSSKKEEESDE